MSYLSKLIVLEYHPKHIVVVLQEYDDSRVTWKYTSEDMHNHKARESVQNS